MQTEKRILHDYLESIKDRFLAEDKQDPAWLAEIRDKSYSRLQKNGFPTTKNEAWKYTNLSSFVEPNFKEYTAPQKKEAALENIEKYLYEKDAWARLVFVNGLLAEGLSDITKLKGVEILSLKEAAAREVFKEHFSKLVDSEKNTFVALNNALAKQGLFIHVKKGSNVETPLQILHYTTLGGSEKHTAQIRHLMVLEPTSSMTVVETFASNETGLYFNNTVSEVVLKESATLNYYRIIKEGTAGFHLGTTEVAQGRSSSFNARSFATRGRLSRNEFHVCLNAPGAVCSLDGLYLLGEGQHHDNQILVEHKSPHTESSQLYKGVLDGKARAVFSGKVFIEKDAQKTAAEQTNKNLLLSENAVVDTKPQLEIYADDVKASHGAAVGQIDPKAMFYLKSRGISEARARKLLSYGFAHEMIDRIPLAPIWNEFDQYLLNRFGA